MKMEEVPMSGMPFDDEVELREDGKIAVYKGFWYRLIEDGYELYATGMTFDPTNKTVTNDFDQECYSIPRGLVGKPVVSIRYHSNIFPSNGKRPQKMNIPDSVVNIDPLVIKALSGRKKLKLTVDFDNPKFSIIDGNLCSKDGKTLLAGIGKGDNGDEIFVVPNGIATIGSYALNYGDFAGIVIPLSVQRIAHSESTKNGDDLALPYYRWDGFGGGRSDGSSDFKYNIYYAGTKEDWKKIDVCERVADTIKYNKDKIKLYFYSEIPDKNTWHYAADGVTPEINAKEGVISKLFKLFKKE